MDTPEKNREPWHVAYLMLRKAHAEYVLYLSKRAPADGIHEIDFEPYAWATAHNIEEKAKAGKLADERCFVNIFYEYDENYHGGGD